MEALTLAQIARIGVLEQERLTGNVCIPTRRAVNQLLRYEKLHGGAWGWDTIRNAAAAVKNTVSEAATAVKGKALEAKIALLGNDQQPDTNKILENLVNFVNGSRKKFIDENEFKIWKEQRPHIQKARNNPEVKTVLQSIMQVFKEFFQKLVEIFRKARGGLIKVGGELVELCRWLAESLFGLLSGLYRLVRDTRNKKGIAVVLVMGYAYTMSWWNSSYTMMQPVTFFSTINWVVGIIWNVAYQLISGVGLYAMANPVTAIALLGAALVAYITKTVYKSWKARKTYTSVETEPYDPNFIEIRNQIIEFEVTNETRLVDFEDSMMMLGKKRD